MKENSVETAVKFLAEMHDKGFGDVEDVSFAPMLVAYADYLQQEEKLSLEERKQRFVEELRPYLESVGKDTLNAFSRCWLERKPNGKKFRFEKEKTWNTKMRIVTWLKNEKKFSIANMLNK